MTAALLLAFACQLPDEGLALRLQTGDVFNETLDVQTITRPPEDPDAPAVRSEYKLGLTTEVGPVGQSGADVRSRVETVFAKVTAPGPDGADSYEAIYDSEERVEFDTLNDEDANQVANEALRDNWSAVKGSALRRNVSAENVYSEGDWVGFVGEGDAAELAGRLLVSLTDIISAPLPTARLDSWTRTAEWQVGGEDREVTQVLTYDGRNSDGMDRIKISLASGRNDPAAVVGKGELLFDRGLDRVTSFDLIVQANAISEGNPVAVTRTNVAWRLAAVPKEEPAAQ